MSWWLPIVIFFAEACVVTFSTLRTIFVARGMKPFAACLGLVEASIWLFAISQVVSNLQHIPCSIAYALGFVTGNYLGMTIEEMLAIGTQVVRIITSKEPDQLVASLNAANFGVTCMDAAGATGPVRVIFTIVKRHQMAEVVKILRQHDSQLFYTVEDIRRVQKGVFRERKDKPAENRKPSKRTQGVVTRMEPSLITAGSASSPPTPTPQTLPGRP
jgi:uncharacterized protein YebE (UPF0316 family)